MKFVCAILLAGAAFGLRALDPYHPESLLGSLLMLLCSLAFLAGGARNCYKRRHVRKLIRQTGPSRQSQPPQSSSQVLKYLCGGLLILCGAVLGAVQTKLEVMPAVVLLMAVGFLMIFLGMKEDNHL